MVSKEQINKCVEIAKKYGVRKLVLFGSAYENPEDARDIDLLADGVNSSSFFAMGADMEEETGIQVDLIPMEPETRFVRYNLFYGRILYAA
ncbi:MAG: nucleotidyltransferase domain-containing protein [Fibrobacterota bacterium]